MSHPYKIIQVTNAHSHVENSGSTKKGVLLEVISDPGPCSYQVAGVLINWSQPFTTIVHYLSLLLYSYIVACNSTHVIIIMYDLRF